MFVTIIDLVKWERRSLNIKCVKCGSKIEAGYIQCGDGVFWSKKKLTAHKCENCRQIVIEY